MSTERPNIVLICVDQWRGDCLSIDGHPVVHTPYLDQLAGRGARFGRAYSAVPTCIAARAGLMTGLTPASHGRVGYQDGVPWDYETTLAGEFTRHGYQTQAVGKMHVFPERTQLGFQNVILHDGFLHHARKQAENLDLIDDYLPWLRQQVGRDADYFEHGVNCNSIVARPWDRDEYLHPTNFIVHQSIDFLRKRDPRKPFFLFMSFHRPHPPYDPPRWAFEQYINAPMQTPPVGDWVDLWAEHEQSWNPEAQVSVPRPDLLQRARAGYYGHMTHIDHQINRFVEALTDAKLRDNTWICFTSDHGEQMGDHNQFRKSTPYEGSARIPLILNAPRHDLLPRGARCDEAVELRDVMPTLLEAAGLPVPDAVEGRSLLPLLRGECSAWRPYVHGEHTAFGQSVKWLTDGREKYVWCSGSGREQLFDLVNDPQELHDRSGDADAQQALAAWRGRMIDELKNREEEFVQDGQLQPGRPVQSVLSHIL